MDINNLISNIHWLPVAVLTAGSFVLGFLWHQPFLFGKTWQHENNPDNQKLKINAPYIFGGTAIMHFITLAGLSALISEHDAFNGLITGLLISCVFIFPTLTGTYLFANRSMKLLAIDAGMYIILFTISGLVLGIW